MKYKNYISHQLGDLVTPLGLFLKVREKYSEVLLLESSDYSSKEDSQSYICFESLTQFELKENKLTVNQLPKEFDNIVTEINQYLNAHSSENPDPIDGLFGYTGFESVAHFEKLNLTNKPFEKSIPTIRYDFFRFVIEFDHFRNTIKIIEHCPIGEESQLNDVQRLLQSQDVQSFSFARTESSPSSNFEDNEFKELVDRAKEHCQRGDVFQLVLSRRYQQKFSGDDLNVYRSLRSINPSPYLFYFDYGSYKIFGSSPEAQLKVEDGIAEIHPIAGTFKRTGDFDKDRLSAEALKKDPKESAEHVMLVDLARNDLSKNCQNVEVTKFKQVQFFSHVIHLVSVVEGKVKPDTSSYQVFADSFPAGTLSGAPKRKALELIDKYEPQGRGFYGGGIGMLGFNGNLNHAIIIRTFVSHHNSLYFQAGAGLVISSVRESELQEVNNKLAALNKALKNAETI